MEPKSVCSPVDLSEVTLLAHPFYRESVVTLRLHFSVIDWLWW